MHCILRLLRALYRSDEDIVDKQKVLDMYLTLSLLPLSTRRHSSVADRLLENGTEPPPRRGKPQARLTWRRITRTCVGLVEYHD